MVEITLSSNTVVSTTMFMFSGNLHYKVLRDELNFVIFAIFWDVLGWLGRWWNAKVPTV